MAKSGRLELGDNVFTDTIGLSSTTVYHYAGIFIWRPNVINEQLLSRRAEVENNK